MYFLYALRRKNMDKRILRKWMNASALHVTNQAMQDSIPSCMNIIINDTIENGTIQIHDKYTPQY